MDIKISFFLPSMVDGGAERVTLNLIQYLARHYDLTLDLVLVSATGAFIDQVPPQVNVIDLKSSRTISSLPALISYLRKNRPDALLSGMDFVNVIALSAVKLSRVNTRTVACLHSHYSAQLSNASAFRGRFITPFVKVTHRWADVIVGISKGCGEEFIKATGVGQENMRYIYNPVITDAIAPLAAEPLNHPWFSKGEPPVILAVGRLSHAKNFQLLVDAYAIVKESHAARLIILGDGEDRPDLESRVKSLDLENDVELPGFVANPYAYMKNSAVYVLSSRYEALPTVLIEAMYCGTQLVAVDCPSGPREILADGKYGELVSQESTSELVEAIIRALKRKDFEQDPAACERFMDYSVADQYLDALLGESAVDLVKRSE